MALVVLSALLGILWWFGGRPTRPPRLLGSLGSDRDPEEPHAPVELRGVGRFARARTHPPEGRPR